MNITHIKWDTFVRNFEFLQGTPEAPVNLTGAVVKFTIKKNISWDNILTQNATITDALNGKSKVSFTSEQMNLPPRAYFYDLQLTDSLWVVTTLLKGSFSVSYDVTN
jgi:hypothetical protein